MKAKYVMVMILLLVMTVGFEAKAETMYATANLNIRTRPSTQSDIVDTVPENTKFEVSEIENGWASISYDGTTRYVCADYLDGNCEIWIPYNDGKDCNTTCYCLCRKCCGKNWEKAVTASGETPMRYVTVANGALPFGTRVYIEDLGYRIVQDRGSGVGENHFDIYVGVQNHEYASEWGCQKRKVWIIKEAK